MLDPRVPAEIPLDANAVAFVVLPGVGRPWIRHVANPVIRVQ